ncbi:outer membrane protein, putative [Geotalea daltonii FRC-32]|uniref:Outer membrane protein, putative n=1 Tax=Geotalea daltonii (strain DSM 22248 / JCM 15807 / FRC-32) TaxID=316067 RepID=B9M7K9_GEODF|nr:outer membrane beta-barrel protein [Geotalea daltonii]ACM22115.1 outer membrane protein, putative [Geotalea daltonii FRC-32]
MKRTCRIFILAVACIALSMGVTAGSAFAGSIQNRLGVTGRLGFIIPTDSDLNDFKINSDAGFIGGGGIIYGLDKNIALEADITHTWFGSSLPSGRDTGEFSITNIAMGGQYRFPTAEKLSPYAGAGLDILVNDYEGGDVDTVLGGHISGGADYFITRNLAVNAELRAVLAPDADIEIRGTKAGNFSPGSISGTFGVRYFF